MAKVFLQRAEPKYDSERRALNSLRRHNDDWRVFHNIKWQALRQGDSAMTRTSPFRPSQRHIRNPGEGWRGGCHRRCFYRRQPNLHAAGRSSRVCSVSSITKSARLVSDWRVSASSSMLPALLRIAVTLRLIVPIFRSAVRIREI